MNIKQIEYQNYNEEEVKAMIKLYTKAIKELNKKKAKHKCIKDVK